MSNPSQVRFSGPLAGYSSGFRAALEAQGYRREPAASQLQLAAHLSRWLERRGLGVADLTPETIEEFLAARRLAGRTLFRSAKALVPLVDYLRGLGVIAPLGSVTPTTAAERCLETFRVYLLVERSLCAGTVVGYVHITRLFLAGRPEGDLALGHLTPDEIVEFVRTEAPRRGRRTSRRDCGRFFDSVTSRA